MDAKYESRVMKPEATWAQGRVRSNHGAARSGAGLGRGTALKAWKRNRLKIQVFEVGVISSNQGRGLGTHECHKKPATSCN